MKTNGSLESQAASFSSDDAVRAVGQRLINWSRGHWRESGCSGARDGLRISFTQHGARSHLAITRYENEVSQFEELVEDGQLSGLDGGVLTDCTDAQSDALHFRKPKRWRSQTYRNVDPVMLVFEERLVLIDPSNLLAGIDTSPRLNQGGDAATICEQARLLQPDHLVVNQINGQNLLEFGELAAGLSGGAIFLMTSPTGRAAIAKLAGDIALRFNCDDDAQPENIFKARSMQSYKLMKTKLVNPA